MLYLMSKQKGFTLVELMVTITILAIVSAIGFVSFIQTQILGRDARRKSDIKALQVASELYYQKLKVYPNTGCASVPETGCSSLTNPTDWIPGLAPYINKIPADPTNLNTLHYRYTTTGTTFTLCAHLENSSDKDIDANGDYCAKDL
jgi:prepilin-type N-terminal cleavage/methylation domain-containing protein